MWADGLPPPPREVYALLEEATAQGYWLKWARYAYHASQDGGRYKVTRARDTVPLLVTDDLEAVRAFLRA
ncbi:hypothetical protein [Luteimonas sp. A501]